MTGLPPNGLLDAVPAAALEEACGWEQHIVEVLTGLVAGRSRCAVVAAMRTAIAEAKHSSTRTAGFVIWRTRQLLAAEESAGPVPSERTLYRLFARLSQGQRTTGTARSRQSCRPAAR